MGTIATYRAYLLAAVCTWCVWLACAASGPGTTRPKSFVPEIVSAEQFYMLFHSTDDSVTQAEYIAAYPEYARESFYRHIVRMITDQTYKETSPDEYDRAFFLGQRLSSMYAIKLNDPSLKDVFDRIEPIED